MPNQTQLEHILELARELLEDIELSKLGAEKLLLKCARLARLAGSDETQKWLEHEMMGYNNSSEIALKYMGFTGRWSNYEKKLGYLGPLAEHEASIIAMQAKMEGLKLPSVSGDKAYLSTNAAIGEIVRTEKYISTLSALKSRVLALMHNFVSEIYYDYTFESLAETTFERYKREVDGLIGFYCGDVLKKIPSVVDRLSEGSEEGVSQALTTCRRIIESFADAVFPPTDDTIEIGGNILKLDASKVMNRINAYISKWTESKSRRNNLRQNLSNLYDRVSAGVHSDVTNEEEFSLFLNTYLFLGEVLHLEVNTESPSQDS